MTSEEPEDDVHVDWHMTREEWNELRDALLFCDTGPGCYMNKLRLEGKLEG